MNRKLAYHKKDIAENLGVCERTVDSWLAMGLRYAKIGAKTFIKPEWFDEFLESKAQAIDQDQSIEAGLSGLKTDIARSRKRSG